MARAQPARKSERRAEIVQAAGELFASQGIKATTVRGIGDRVGVLSGSLYHHFRTKDEIVHELMRAYREELLDRYQQAVLRPGTTREVLERLIRIGLWTVVEHPSEHAILQHDMPYLSNSESFEYIHDMVRQVERIYLNAIEAGKASGEIRCEIDSRLVYRMIMDSVRGVNRWFDASRHSVDEVVAKWLDLLCQGIEVTPPEATS